MKKYIYISIFSLGLLTTSCENFLDRSPKSDISVDMYWETEQDLKTWNAGMYDGLQNTLQTGWFDWGELRGGTFAPRGTGWDTNLLYNGLTSTSGSSSWKNLYATIYRANAGIKYIPEVPVVETVAAPYLAQAYAMRALMYFYAIRVWGDVPMITEPLEDSETQERYYGRASIQDIKTLMMADLETAMELFGPESKNIAAASKYYLNRGSAMALKLDVLMWYRNYDEALVVANDLIDKYGYELAPNSSYIGQFLAPGESKEMILNLFWNYIEDDKGFGYSQRIASGSNTIQYHPTKEMFNELIGRKYESDSRINLVLDTLWISQKIAGYGVKSISNETYENFYANQYGNPTEFQVKCPKFAVYSATAIDKKAPGYIYPKNAEDNTQMPIYRLADILLLKAEALVQCSTPDLQGAIDIVNDIRERAGWTREATITDYNTVDKVLKLVIDERTIELWAEGKHWFDLVRNNKVKEYLDPYMRGLEGDYVEEEGFVIGVPIPTNPIGGYGKILWPLNQDVFKKNPLMSGKQNAPYTE